MPTPALGSAPGSVLRRPTGLGSVAVAAVALVVGFRVGLLRGGLVGVDVGLAAIGWWAASLLRSGAAPAEVVAGVWRRSWLALLAAIALAIAWVLTASSTALDATARGQALGIFGGYGNWHVLATGPVEVLGSRTDTPLQGLWPWAVLVQSLGLLLLLHVVTRPRARRRPEHRDPLVVVASAVAGLGLVIAIGMAVGGASGQGVLLATPGRAAALLGGAALGAMGATGGAATVRAIADGLRLPAVVGLGVLALAVEPTDGIGVVASLLAPILAVVVVASMAPGAGATASGSLPEPAVADEAPDRPLDPWVALISLAVLHGPAIALVARPSSALPSIVAGLVGAVLAVVLAWGVAVASARLRWDREAIDARRVLVPPLAVLLVVGLFAATGAFHWASPTPRNGADASGS